MTSWTLLGAFAFAAIIAVGFVGQAQAACTVGVAPNATPSTLGTMANQPTDQVVIRGGCIDSTPIGANTPSTGAFSTLSATGTLVNTGNVAGAPTHLLTQQLTAPALTSCGTGSPAITGTDTAGIVTMGTNATGCVITFNVAYTGTPFCVVSWIATPLASQSYVTSNVAITATQTSASGNKLQYACLAPAGG